jgi:IS5 family transposase
MEFFQNSKVDTCIVSLFTTLFAALIDSCEEKLTAMNDPLVKLKKVIDFEDFRTELSRIYEKDRKSGAGRKHFDVVLMFKVLILQQYYNLSDDGIEYQIRDRLSFMRFLGLRLGDQVPDAKTIWLFRERLKTLELVEVLFARFSEQLARHGYVAKSGQIIDATFLEVPRQRNSREENAKIKSGEIPDGWDAPEQVHKRSQKDVEARWTKKNSENHYGYKNHINVDAATKLIQVYTVTAASVHDSQAFEALLDTETTDTEDRKRTVYADSAYRSAKQETNLQEQGIESQIHEKGTCTTPLTEEQKASNRAKSKVRCRVEHIFGAQAAMGGHIVRTIGLARANVKIGMMNLAYNMKRLVQLATGRAQAKLIDFSAAQNATG